MTFNEYINISMVKANESNGTLRFGQVLANELHKSRPRLSGKVSCAIDPFYTDENIPAFLEFVGSNW